MAAQEVGTGEARGELDGEGELVEGVVEFPVADERAGLRDEGGCGAEESLW